MAKAHTPKVPQTKTLDAAAVVRSAPSARPPPPGDDRAPTLDELLASTRPVSPATRALALMALDDAQRLEYGRAIDSDVLVESATAFAASAYAIFRGLDDARREKLVGVNLSLLDLLVIETAGVRDRKATLDAHTSHGNAGRAQRRAEAKRAMREGIALRDQVYTALRSVTPDTARTALDSAVGNAADAQSLSLGMRGVARILRERIAASTPEQRAALASIKLDDARVAALEKGAAEAVSTDTESVGSRPDARVTQRELDLQDGLVVHLTGMLYRAFREGAAALPGMMVPPLGEFARFFGRPAGRPAAPPPVTPPAKPA